MTIINNKLANKFVSKLQINKNISRQSIAFKLHLHQLHSKLKPIHCIFYRNVIKVALFAIKNGGSQIDIIDILDIITLLSRHNYMI